MNGRLNRRISKRIPVRLPVHLSTIDPELRIDQGRRLFRLSNGVCLNLSRGGAQIRMPGSMQPGTRVLVEIYLPGAPSFETVGKIIWGRSSATSSDGANLGVQFLRSADGHTSPLDNFIHGKSGPHSKEVAYMR